jgi:polyisoprenoid-binding protein YceI
MNRFVIPLLLCLALAVPTAGLAADYQLDADHSSISFKVSHLAVSSVTGRFNKIKGTASIQGDDLASRKVQVIIEATSVDTGHAKRDEHIRSADFLDTAKYPTITFVSKKFLKDESGKMRIAGDLTLHGVTREITVELKGFTPEIKDPWGMFRRGTAATAVIDRRDFGITWSKALDYGLAVGNEVSATIEIEWVRKP